MRTLAAMSWLGLLLVVGCGGDEKSISMQPLSGQIGGQAWTFGTGQTNSVSIDDRIGVDLYPGTFQTCVAFGAPTDVDKVLLSVPMTPGSYDLGFDLTVTLYDASANISYAALSGRLVVDSITTTTITGGVHASYGGGRSEVNGQFQAAICP